jgi:hypothetical protein
VCWEQRTSRAPPQCGTVSPLHQQNSHPTVCQRWSSAFKAALQANRTSCYSIQHLSTQSCHEQGWWAEMKKTPGRRATSTFWNPSPSQQGFYSHCEIYMAHTNPLLLPPKWLQSDPELPTGHMLKVWSPAHGTTGSSGSFRRQAPV